MPLAAQSTGEPERWSELADTIFKNYGADDGLPTSPVTAFAEDGSGFLWVGTQAGLARWDGYHFRLYRSDPADSGALQSGIIWCIQKDRQGRPWVGTNNGGVSRYDPETDRFATFAIGPSDRENLPVRSLADDGADGMWVGSDRGLDHLASDGKVLEHFQHRDDDPSSLPGDQVLALLRDSAGTLWIGTNSGLARRKEGAPGFTGVRLNASGTEMPAVHSLIEAGDGRIWAGTRNEGVFAFSPSGHPIDPVHRMSPDLAHLTIRGLAEAAPGVIWLGTDGQGIVVLDAASGKFTRIRHDSARASSLAHDFIFSLYRDNSGLMWTATYAGPAMHDTRQAAVRMLYGGSSSGQGLAGADVLATLAARDGKVWVTYLAGGADILDPAGHRLSSLRHDPARPRTTLPPDRVRAITQSEKGDVFLGTYHGLYRADPDGRNIAPLPLSPQISDARILALFSDESGLWVGTYAEGLWRLDYGTGRFTRHAVTGFTDQWISAIAPTGDGRLWVGSFQGLFLFDPASDRVRQFLPDPSDARARHTGPISSMVRDRKGRVWVGMLNTGLVRIDGFGADGALHLRWVDLPSSSAETLLDDDLGGIWAEIDDGQIARIDSDTLAVQILTHAEGVGLRGGVMNAGAVTSHGEILFGGDNGLAVIRPDHLKPWDWHPPVVVTDLRIGRREIPPASVIGRKTPLQITPDMNSVSVEFAALDYSAPNSNRYAYRLEGYDRDWVTTDARHRLASYTNLPPRRYVLHLRGSNRDGVWTEATLDIPIEVLPAWYQTLQFKFTVAALAVLGIWLLVRARTAYLRHQQMVLENQVAQRTVELKQSNIQLEARTAELGKSLIEAAESRAKVANLLDNSGQGFFSFGSDLTVEPGCSRACAMMLGRAPEGWPADEILFGEDRGKAELFRKVVSGALASEDPFKRDLLFSLLPTTVERRGRLLKAEYRRLDNGHVMVVLTDITEEHRLSQKIENERLRLSMIVMAVTERRDFFDALESFRQFFRQGLMEILAARAAPLSIYQEIYRHVHTLKGTLAQFCFDATPKMLHRLEESLTALKRDGDMMTTGKIVELVLSVDYHDALESDLDILRNALGEEFLDHGKGVFLSMPQASRLRAVAERMLAGDTLDLSSEEIQALFTEFRNLDKVALADALSAYDRVIGQVAKRLEKEVAPLSIDGGSDLWLDPELYGPFLRSLVHIFRNAVVHGIEDPEQRLADGKNPVGKIECAVRLAGPMFTLTIADDGMGIDSLALRDRAVSLGLMTREAAAELPEDEAIALIFADNVSVLNQADELAGRGVGLAAVRAETHALGGTVQVASALGAGTRFTFSIPYLEKLSEGRTVDAEGA